MKKHLFIPGLMTLALLFTACDDKPKPDGPSNEEPMDVWVVSEGSWHSNNAEITAYNSASGSVIPDYFSRQNGRGLGDVANDILIYGSKAYVVVNISSTLEVLDTKNGKSLRQLTFFDERQTARQPRRICAGSGKVYLCCFDGSVLRIDTATLTVEAMGTAGSNPDGICLSNGKLYVSNSGGLNFPNYDSTVSVMDPVSLQTLKTLRVRLNPMRSLSDRYGHVWVMSAGNYKEIAGCVQCIDSETDSVIAVFEGGVMDFDGCGSALYLMYYDENSRKMRCDCIDAVSLQRRGTLFATGDLTLPYGISVREKDGTIWITDALDYASNGNVHCFDQSGNQLHRFEAGFCPKRIAFIE